MPPEPIMPTTWLSFLARYLTPSPAPPPPRAARDANVLQDAVVAEREGHPVARAEHEQQPAIRAGLDAVLVLALVAFFPRPADDIREHARDDVAVAARAAGHERPAIITFRPLAGKIDVDAPHRRGVALDDFLLRRLERVERHRHSENLLHIVVLEQQHEKLLFRITSGGGRKVRGSISSRSPRCGG